MEKHLMEKIKTILNQEKDICNVDIYINLEGNWVVSYEYNNEKYLVSIDMI